MVSIMAWRPGQPVQLESARYRLRSLALADLTARYIGWFGDAELMRLMGYEPDIPLERLMRRFRAFDNRLSFRLGVFCREFGLLIGHYDAHVNYRNRVARTAVLIGDRAHWGKGTVVETRSALLDFLFDTVRVERVWGRVHTRNFPSIFNYKALGFQCEGLLRKQYAEVDGSRIDMYVFGLLREEWLAHRQRGLAV